MYSLSCKKIYPLFATTPFALTVLVCFRENTWKWCPSYACDICLTFLVLVRKYRGKLCENTAYLKFCTAAFLAVFLIEPHMLMNTRKFLRWYQVVCSKEARRLYPPNENTDIRWPFQLVLSLRHHVSLMLIVICFLVDLTCAEINQTKDTNKSWGWRWCYHAAGNFSWFRTFLL